MTRLNWHVRVRMPAPGVRVPGSALVPYRSSHVPVYHSWMQSPDLLRLTGSEALSREEEEENQQSWRDDPGKVTFIVLGPAGAPVGDVNLFLHGDGQPAELNVMIAEPAARGKGLAQQACAGMMLWAGHALGVKEFQAKIQLDNQASINLFSKKLGFLHTSKDDVFQETTMTSGPNTLQLCAAILGGEPITSLMEECEDLDVRMARERGNEAFRRNDYENAIYWFDVGLALDWMDHFVLSNRSLARLKWGDFYGAVLDAAMAVGCCPDKYAKGRMRLGAAYGALGMWEEAQAVLKEGAKLYPEEKSAMQKMASALGKTPDSRIEQTARYRNCCTVLPAFVKVHCLTPMPPKVILGEVLWEWQHMSGQEKASIFDVYCEITKTQPVVMPLPEQWEEINSLPTNIPGAVGKDDLPKAVLEFLKANARPEQRIAVVELLFSSCSKEQRATIANVLLSLMEKALNPTLVAAKAKVMTTAEAGGDAPAKTTQ